MPLVLCFLLVMTHTAGAVCACGDRIVPRSTSGAAFSLDMTASVDPIDITAIDVVITVRDIRQELNAVEFVLDFDKNLVEGVITENGSDMDIFMTAAPMYTMVIAGVEVPSCRYEQICSYDGEAGTYHCRFVDSLRYPNAKPDEVRKGLIDDGDLVITIPFRLVSLPEAGGQIEFTITDALATTRADLLCVKGKADTASVELVQVGGPVTPDPTDPPSIDETTGTTGPSDIAPTEMTGGGADIIPTDPTQDTGNVIVPSETAGEGGSGTETAPTDPTEATGIQPTVDSGVTDGATTVPEGDSGEELPTDPSEMTPDVPAQSAAGGDTEGSTEGTGAEPQGGSQHPGKPGSFAVAVAIALVAAAVGVIAVVIWKTHRKMR